MRKFIYKNLYLITGNDDYLYKYLALQINEEQDVTPPEHNVITKALCFVNNQMNRFVSKLLTCKRFMLVCVISFVVFEVVSTAAFFYVIATL